MSYAALLQRTVIVLCCLISFGGCANKSSDRWVYDEMVTPYPCYNSKRLIICSKNTFTHLELEILSNHSCLRMYLNILFMQAPPCTGDPKRTKLTIIHGENTWMIYPYLLQGGQRLLFTKEDTQVLIDILLKGESFTIQLGHKELEVTPDGFADYYSKISENANDNEDN